MLKRLLTSVLLFFIFGSPIIWGQSTILFDDLNNNTLGTRHGGSLSSEGFKPGSGNNHITYTLSNPPYNGYLEFEIKGFSMNDFNPITAENIIDNQTFCVLYDGRGIPQPLSWSPDYRNNYNRWEIVYLSPKYNNSTSGDRFKAKMMISSAETNANLNDGEKAVFPTDAETHALADWKNEPSGIRKSWNSNTWYTIRVTWDNTNKIYQVHRDGEKVWDMREHQGQPWSGDEFPIQPPFPRMPGDFKINLGAGPGTYYPNYSSNLVFRNFSVVNLDGVIIPDTLLVSPTNVTVSSNSGNTILGIVSNIDWVTSTNDDWLSISSSSGSGDENLTVSYESNPTEDERIGTIKLEGNGIQRTISINQSGTPPDYIIVTPENLSVDFILGTVLLDIESNVNWSINSDSEWVSIFPSDSTGNAQVTVNYLQNNKSNARTAIITISNDSLSTNLSLLQSGSSYYVNISPQVWPVSYKSGEAIVNIESNHEWNIYTEVNWLTPSVLDTNGDVSFMVDFYANTDTSSRIGVLYIESEYILDSVEFVQEGAVPYEIITSVYPEDGGTILGTGIYGEGSYVTLKAIENDGWQFDYWSENGNIVYEDTAWTFKINSQRDLVANFSPLTNFEENIVIPQNFDISQNYPNPFNPSTSIGFSLPVTSSVAFTIFNSLGEILYEIKDARYFSGEHQIYFNGSNLTSGIYFYSIRAIGDNGEQFMTTKKMILLK